MLGVALALAACSSAGDGKSTALRATPRVSIRSPLPTAQGLTKCKYPKKISFPEWLPSDLPLPPGTYAYKHLPAVSGYRRALFVLKVGTKVFARLVLKKWPKVGYALGRGDSEPGEVEDTFRKGKAVGA